MADKYIQWYKMKSMKKKKTNEEGKVVAAVTTIYIRLKFVTFCFFLLGNFFLTTGKLFGTNTRHLKFEVK